MDLPLGKQCGPNFKDQRARDYPGVYPALSVKWVQGQALLCASDVADGLHVLQRAGWVLVLPLGHPE